MRKSTIATAVATLISGQVLAAAPGSAPSTDEMWRVIQAQAAEIRALKQSLAATNEKTEAVVEAVEQGTGSAASIWTERTRMGGYAEVHYNNLDGSGGATDKDEIDLHRFVLFFGHEFNDDIRFFSELEVEHGIAGEGQVGEVEVEQAFVEFDLNDQHRAKGGVFLLPVGIMNETHEPNTFYGVERNPVEKDIIPATWWAAGAALSGQMGQGFSYDLAVHEGLKTSSADSYKPRAGRQKSGKADASELAYTGRLKWTGMLGVELAATLQHQSDITQDSDAGAGSATLVEMHAALSRGPWGLRALYAQWELDGSGPAAIGADEQNGFYIEPSFRLNEKLGVFARYNQWDNAAGSSSASEKKQWDMGVNYWPHPDVVVKADYQQQDNADGRDQDGFNLGIGLQF